MSEGIKIPTAEEIQAIANAKASEIIAAKDREQALATHLAKVHGETAEARLQLAEASKKKDESDKAIEALKNEKAKATEDVANLTKQLEAAKAELVEAQAASKKGDLEKAKLLEEKKAVATELNTLKSTQKAQARKTELATANIATPKLVAKATATAEDGSLALSDEAFNDLVNEAKEIAEAAKKGDDGKGANGAPAPTSESKKNPGEVDSSVNHNTNAKGPAGAANASVTPAAPVIPNGAEAAAQAMASILSGGTAPTLTGAAKWAAMFPINEGRR